MFQSTIVLRHFVSQFAHRYMLGHTPLSSGAPNLLANFHSHFDLVVGPCELHTEAYLSFLGSSDLSQASLSFDLVVDPYEVSY